MIKDITKPAMIIYKIPPTKFSCYKNKLPINLQYLVIFIILNVILWLSFSVLYYYNLSFLIELSIWFAIGFIISKLKL